MFGPDIPPIIGPGVPHAARNPLGRIRVDMEAAYRASGVKTVILRAGDFLDTGATGNWFDRIIAARIDKGVLRYPGPLDRPHAWAYLPDLAEAFTRIADRLEGLPVFSDLAFEGYTLIGTGLAEAVSSAIGRPLKVKSMSWAPIRLAQPVWPMVKHLIEMRYLWQVPHQLDGSALSALLPALPSTRLADALKQASKLQINPD